MNNSQNSNYFQTIKLVLDDLYDRMIYPSEKRDDIIRRELQNLSEKYHMLEHGGPDYSTTETHFAYLYCYASAHASLVCQRLNDTNRQSNLFAKFIGKGSLQVSCLGAGPGNDLLGILRFMEICNIGSELRYHAYDKHKQWYNPWQQLINIVHSSRPMFPEFRVLDVFNSKASLEYMDIYQSDLFTMSFFLSEVVFQKDHAEDFFRNLLRKAKSGAIFLFIDNAARTIAAHRWFDQMVAQYNTEVSNHCYLGNTSRGYNMSRRTTGQINYILRGDNIKLGIAEHKGIYDLNPYYDKFSKQGAQYQGNPRTTVKCYYRICYKQ